MSLASVHTALILIQGMDALSITHATTRIEAFVLNGVQRIANSETLYLGFENLGQTNIPYITHVYNPLTYLPTGLLSQLFELSPESTLLIGRLISFLSALVLTGLLSYWTWKQTRDWKACLLVGIGLYFFQSYALTDFFRLRPETPALLFTFAGVIAFLSSTKNKLPLCAPLLFTAFMIKQSYITAPIAIVVYLLLIKNYRDATRFSILMGGMLILFYSLMYFANGEQFFQNTISALAVNEIHPFTNMTYYFPYLFAATFGLLLAIPVAAYGLFTTEKNRHALTFLFVYLALSVSWTFIKAGKTGAGDNYFSELIILLLILVTLSISSLNKAKPVLSLILLTLLSTQVIARVVNEGLFTPQLAVQFEDASNDLSVHIKKYNYIPGERLILHEKIAVHVGNPAGLDWYLLDILNKKNKIDLQPLFNKISAGQFSTIVFNQRPLTQLEAKIFNTARNGPYTRTYVDNVVSEWSYAR